MISIKKKRNFLKKINIIKQINQNINENDYCCAEGEFLFHDLTEFKEFNDEEDFFSLS